MVTTIARMDGKVLKKKASLKMVILNENDDLVKKVQEDLFVMRHYYRVKSAEVLHETRELADRGDHLKA
eukprot:CAMPEP_0114577640 /NCGR_PEP_ID=MMETSP0125-20121206/2278_1 /TAXON_ID=485358 ORGANISM="Aristerostoma sp., Strain ATCC 50986" /NCGR_SAMPLE_ID=MMETSP0125 /ASSEMBLY_ACC=CAM_ASM_000245 /LENGTH=68 /DNA_ID=CAMNT_0001767109 /DNA_START=2180 /DNA_END=2386 /DNA_ORIENTATION=-